MDSMYLLPMTVGTVLTSGGPGDLVLLANFIGLLSERKGFSPLRYE